MNLTAKAEEVAARFAAPQPSASVVWELEAAKHAQWEAFEGDSSGMVDDAERAKRNMRLWHAIEATLELSAAPQPSAPEGWMLVPREPTEAMMQAGLYQSSADTEWSDVYSMWVDMWDVATGRSVEVVALASPPTGRDATEEGWQHIATAPKDSSEFQAWVEDADGRGFWEPRARFNDQTEAFEQWGRVGYDEDGWEVYPHLHPTHWRPLPAAPKPETAQKGGKP